jgi:hypothetical protein
MLALVTIASAQIAATGDGAPLPSPDRIGSDRIGPERLSAMALMPAP